MEIETAHPNGAPRPLPGILQLTSETRHRIYLYLGVAQRRIYGKAAPIIYDLGDPSRFKIVNSESQFDDGPASFHSLLLSCRTISSEVSAFLYSANWFVIHYQARKSLVALRALTPNALASLANLKIVLNQGSCHRREPGTMGFEECCGRIWAYKQPLNGSPRLLYGCGADHGDAHDYPLTAASPPTEDVIEDWLKTAAYLASYITPGQLELSLVCDVGRGDVEIARRILDGFRLLPRLKDCHIRLCETRHPQLQQLAQEAARHARGIDSSKLVGRSPSSSSSSSLGPSLLSLPPEIRLRILQYTDLITPSKEVMWKKSSSVVSYYIQRPPCYEEWGPSYCPPHCNQGCRFSHCWRTIFPQPSIGCFCSARHTAASSRCKCWAPPTPLFLVCRTLYAEANMVFYRGNRFIVIDAPGTGSFQGRPPGDYPHKSFAASHFLKKVIPPHCLTHLRFLEVVFSVLTHENRPRDDHPAFQDWDDTWDWVKGKLNLPTLTLRLAVAAHPDRGRGPPESWEMTREQGKMVLATYNRIILPLQRLGGTSDGGGGLARFYASLPWPLKWSREATRRLAAMDRDARSEWLDSKDREIKIRAERYVMGDRYNHVSTTGAEPQRSVWAWGTLDLYF
ncbi:uncharacterized protein C8A04DRAFT_9349 [Dichotomopilus funicola]|uniref:F-box domain-containing protein n=1 Tax=Dichotomopilus funicola TaxID=1934379 RepID=A0AAN6ZR57_9PEZI|nr:hypothetical protein C8A04DRAFT_9349 [Dichotomopilus funicola]